MEINKILAQKNGILNEVYHEKIIELIRKKYDLNEELAILRKLSVGELSNNSETVKEYNNYINYCKSQAYLETYNN